MFTSHCAIKHESLPLDPKRKVFSEVNVGIFPWTITKLSLLVSNLSNKTYNIPINIHLISKDPKKSSEWGKFGHFSLYGHLIA